jgi:hypothetical protein
MSSFFDEPRQPAGFHIYFYKKQGVQQAAHYGKGLSAKLKNGII